MPEPPVFADLVATLRRLPVTLAGQWIEDDRVLTLSRDAGAVVLRLHLKAISYNREERMFDASVRVPAQAGETPTIGSLKKFSDGAFRKSEQRMLGPMLAWADRVLSASPPPALARPAQAGASWKRPLQRVLDNVAGGSRALSRRFFEREGDAPEDMTATARADVLIDFLRSEGHWVGFDWRDDDQLLPLCRIQAEVIGRADAAAALGRCEPVSLESDVPAARAALGSCGLALIEISTGSDDYGFLICPADRVDAVDAALTAIGLTTLPADAARRGA